jgi:hypothetical protein
MSRLQSSTFNQSSPSSTTAVPNVSAAWRQESRAMEDHLPRAARLGRSFRLSPPTQSNSRSQVCSAMKVRSPRNHSDRARATSLSPTPVV